MQTYTHTVFIFRFLLLLLYYYYYYFTVVVYVCRYWFFFRYSLLFRKGDIEYVTHICLSFHFFYMILRLKQKHIRIYMQNVGFVVGYLW